MRIPDGFQREAARTPLGFPRVRGRAGAHTRPSRTRPSRPVPNYYPDMKRRGRDRRCAPVDELSSPRSALHVDGFTQGRESMKEQQVLDVWAQALAIERKRAEQRTKQLADDSAALINAAVDWCRKQFPNLCENDEPHYYLVLGAIAIRKRVGEGNVDPAEVFAWAHRHHDQMAKRGQGDPEWPQLHSTEVEA